MCRSWSIILNRWTIRATIRVQPLKCVEGTTNKSRINLAMAAWYSSVVTGHHGSVAVPGDALIRTVAHLAGGDGLGRDAEHHRIEAISGCASVSAVRVYHLIESVDGIHLPVFLFKATDDLVAEERIGTVRTECPFVCRVPPTSHNREQMPAVQILHHRKDLTLIWKIACCVQWPGRWPRDRRCWLFPAHAFLPLNLATHYWRYERPAARPVVARRITHS